jgi:hypothetical protein
MATAPSARVLTPVTATAAYRTGRSGRREAWGAVSADGVWSYERLEVATTPWEITHVPTGRVVPLWYSSLPNARAATADGTALAEIEKQQAPEGASR